MTLSVNFQERVENIFELSVLNSKVKTEIIEIAVKEYPIQERLRLALMICAKTFNNLVEENITSYQSVVSPIIQGDIIGLVNYMPKKISRDVPKFMNKRQALYSLEFIVETFHSQEIDVTFELGDNQILKTSCCDGCLITQIRKEDLILTKEPVKQFYKQVEYSDFKEYLDTIKKPDLKFIRSAKWSCLQAFMGEFSANLVESLKAISKDFKLDYSKPLYAVDMFEVYTIDKKDVRQYDFVTNNEMFADAFALYMSETYDDMVKQWNLLSKNVGE